MFSYTHEQTVHCMGDLMIGGQPGEYPTLAVGTVFYEGQFKEPKKELETLAELIIEQRELAEELDIQQMIDFFVYSTDELDWKLDFILDTVEGFFSLDMPESEVRIKALKRLDEVGALDRVVLNSINLGITDEERRALKEHTPASAVFLAYDPQDNSTQGRLNIIKGGGKLIPEGLLNIANIDLPLLDTAVTPFGEGVSEALRAVPVFKSKCGLPTGCAMHNAVESWSWLSNDHRKKALQPTLDAAIDVMPIMMGADFVYYGPLEYHSLEFPTIAMVDKLVAEGAETYFGTEIKRPHPYYKL